MTNAVTLTTHKLAEVAAIQVPPFADAWGYNFEAYSTNDWNRDGYGDILITFTGNNQSIDIEIGDPTNVLLISTGSGYSDGSALLPNLDVKGWVNDVVTSDYNQDGYPDFLLVDHGREGAVHAERPLGWVWLWTSNLLGSDISYQESQISNRQFWHGAVNARDATGDGFAEFTAATIGPIGYWTFSPEIKELTPLLPSLQDWSEFTGVPGYHIANDGDWAAPAVTGFIDLRGGGDQDIIGFPYVSPAGTGAFQDRGIIYTNNGDGDFTGPTIFDFKPNDWPANRGVSTFRVSDFNSDGLEDVIAYAETGGDQEGRAFLYLGIQASNGTLIDKTVEAFGSSELSGGFTGYYSNYNNKVEVLDYNQDGYWDLLFPKNLSSFGEIRETNFSIASLFINDGTGRFTREEIYPTSQQISSVGFDNVSLLSVVPTEANGDGVTDFILVKAPQDKSSITLYSLLSKGSDVSDLTSLHVTRPNASLKGSSAIDTTLVPASKEYFSIERRGNDIWMTDHVTDLGLVTFSDIERVSFSDVSIAWDTLGNAGNAARILATVFGGATVSNPALVGIALSFFDQGMSLEEVSELALSYALGSSPSSEAVVRLLWGNVIGSEIDSESLAAYSGLIDSGQMSAAQLTAFAASTDVAAELVNLTGLAQTGLAYI